MKNYLQVCILTSCISFTVEMIAFVLMPDALVPDLTKTTILQTFCICVCASFIVVYPVMRVENILKAVLISEALLMLIIIGLGTFLFDLVPLQWEVLLSIIGCSFIIYGLCFFAMSIKNKNDAKEINEQLEKLHKGGN